MCDAEINNNKPYKTKGNLPGTYQLTMSTPMERRKLKFSTAKRDEIQNNLLKDAALLSRSQGTNTQLESLKTDHKKREQLLRQIKNETNDSNIEHGLRKLREIIVSIIPGSRNDKRFLSFAEDVYIMSYEFFFKRKEWGKLGGIVLEFFKDNLLDAYYNKGFLQVYVLYLSHIENNLTKSMEELLRINSNELIDENRYILDLSVIYCRKTQSPRNWFRILQESQLQKRYGRAYQLIVDSGKVNEMQERSYKIASVSYNQLGMETFEQQWLLQIPMSTHLRKGIASTFVIRENKDGTSTIMFKQRISKTNMNQINSQAPLSN
ncbi:hypothetical protein C6P45_002660 [Maudiozyma exigua]|uniref:Uncharacterized protein n=1 Tax=Maudiozyma exigua TaxID=34358 RepID=A0A9P6VX96_MAUEX|nr:hypothetical protein C6P45_002660 [Kazachstania exigua]